MPWCFDCCNIKWHVAQQNLKTLSGVLIVLWIYVPLFYGGVEARPRISVALDVHAYRRNDNYLSTFPKIAGWLQGSSICCLANIAPIYILTSVKCSTQHYAAIHFIFEPFHLHTAEALKSWWLKISEI